MISVLKAPDVKFCKDCKWCLPIAPSFICESPKGQPMVDLLTGDSQTMFCENQRHSIGSCRQEAINFEPKS